MHDDDLDDLDPGPVPAPDDEPTAAERARARSFAELVDKVVAGRAPAAMPAEERALIEVATMIRSGVADAELPAVRRAALVESALRGVVEKAAPASPASPPRDVIPLSRARASRTPWAIAALASAVAVAAILALVLRPARPAAPQQQATQAQALPMRQRSRPADALIGAIPRDRAADAATRLDAIFADRLDGYREVYLNPGLAGASRRGGRTP